MNKKYSQFYSLGFSLIELMITVAVIGILTAVALPSYSAYIERGDRASASAALLSAQQFMERFYAANDTYATDRAGNAVALPANLRVAPAESPRYDLSISAVNGNSYTLTATPRANTTRCGSLTITNTGVKGISSAVATVAECWR